VTSPASPTNAPQPLIVWWVLWGAFQFGIIAIYQFLGQSSTTPPPNEPALWQLGLLPVLISGALRWSLLPKIEDGTKAFVVFILGVALAEMMCFLGLFIFPSHKTLFFAASLLGILQFIPVFAGRYTKTGAGD
jgi:hypothetical protein